jgi:hypothetical protein
MALHMQPPSLSIKVQLPPSWDQIEPLRRYVEECVKAVSEEAAARASMVLQELLENAVKYGDPVYPIEVEAELYGNTGGLILRVRNRAQLTRLALLEKEFHRAVSSGDDAHKAFAMALDRLKRLPQGSSMLGLPRIAMEAKVTLDVQGEYAQMTAQLEWRAPSRTEIAQRNR